VEDAVAGAKYKLGFARRLPGNPDARPQIVSIRVHQRPGKVLSAQRPALIGKNLGDGSESGRHIQADQAVVLLISRAGILVAQTQIQRQTGTQPPIVRNLEAEGAIPQIGAAPVRIDGRVDITP
jgi:hypothetical protein